MVVFTTEHCDIYPLVSIIGRSDKREVIRLLLKETRAYGVVIVSEIWTKTARSQDIQRVGGDSPGLGYCQLRPGVLSATEDPAHREGLMLTWEFKAPAFTMAGHWTRYFRHEGTQIVLEEEETQFGQAEGALANLFS
jgi:hypothetical protein